MENETPEDDEAAIALFGSVENAPKEPDKPTPTIVVDETPIREVTAEDKHEFHIVWHRLLKEGKPYFDTIGSYDWFLPIQGWIREKFEFELQSVFNEHDAKTLADIVKCKAAATKDYEQVEEQVEKVTTNNSGISKKKGFGLLVNQSDWLTPTISAMTKSFAYHALTDTQKVILHYMLETLHSCMCNDDDANTLGIQFTLAWCHSRFNYEKITDKTLTKALKTIIALGFFRRNPSFSGYKIARRYIYINRWRHITKTQAQEIKSSLSDKAVDNE